MLCPTTATYFCCMKGWKHDKASLPDQRAQEIPTPLLCIGFSHSRYLHKGWALVGIPWSSPMEPVWGPGNGQQFKAKRDCSSLGGWMGMRWQWASWVSSCTKIQTLTGNLHRTITRTGTYPVIFIQLLFIFPRQNSHWMHSPLAHCHRRLWHHSKRWAWAPCRRARRDPPVSESWRCVLGGEAIKLYADRETLKICWK